MDTVSILLAYFIDTGKIQYSNSTEEIAIKNWKKYNENASPKVQKFVNEELAKVKNKKLIQYIDSMYTVPILYRQVEEEVDLDKDKEVEGSTDNLVYDFEKYLLNHQKTYESIVINSQKDETLIREVLKKYHLWNVENNKYPKKPIQLIAGLQKWLLNEKMGNGNHKKEEPKSQSPPLRKI